MKSKELAEIVQSFNEISGVEVAISNNKRRICFSKRRECNFCNLIHSSPEALARCLAADSRYIAEVEKTDTHARYTCPFGIEEYIAPIKHNGTIIGFLFCSFGFLEEGYDEERILSIVSKSVPNVSPEQLEAELRLVPRYSESSMRACEKMASIIAEYIGSEDMITNDDVSTGALIKSYINDNITKKITLSDIGYYLHFSTVSLTQHFKTEFGMTIMQYVMQTRLNIARQLLLSSAASIKEVAMSSGFPEVEYFSKCFKKQYGMTPTAYREKMAIKN